VSVITPYVNPKLLSAESMKISSWIYEPSKSKCCSISRIGSECDQISAWSSIGSLVKGWKVEFLMQIEGSSGPVSMGQGGPER